MTTMISFTECEFGKYDSKFIINFMNYNKHFCKIKQIPLNISVYNFTSNKNYESIKNIILKIHSNYSMFLNCKQKENNIFCFEITCFNFKYIINIYKDIESNFFVIEFININMIENIFKLLFTKTKTNLNFF